MSLFNSTYFSLQKNKSRTSRLDYDNYFFPLDRLSNWNRLYGSKGFLQYQFVLPGEGALEGITTVLEKDIEAGQGLVPDSSEEVWRGERESSVVPEIGLYPDSGF